MDGTSGEILVSMRTMGRVWVLLSAADSRAHGPTLSAALLLPGHPAIASAKQDALKAEPRYVAQLGRGK